MTIAPTGVARAEAGTQPEEKRPNAEVNGGGPAKGSGVSRWGTEVDTTGTVTTGTRGSRRVFDVF